MRARLLLLVAVVFTSSAAAQQAYVPMHEQPKGREVVAYYFGSTECGPCRTPEVKKAVMDMKLFVAGQAHMAGASFSAVGVALDWDIDAGTSFLSSVAPFDQVIIGSNWTNLAVERFIWRDSTVTPGLPQIVVVERTVTVTKDGMTFSDPKVLRRVLGGVEIPKWATSGAPIGLKR